MLGVGCWVLGVKGLRAKGRGTRGKIVKVRVRLVQGSTFNVQG